MDKAYDELSKRDIVKKYCEAEKWLAEKSWEEVTDKTISVVKDVKNGGSLKDEAKRMETNVENRLKAKQQL